jgi:surface protein
MAIVSRRWEDLPPELLRLVEEYVHFKPTSKAELQAAVRLFSCDPAAAHARHGPIGDWCTSLITDMSGLFCHMRTFNADISAWDVRRVTDMSDMFLCAESFNQPLHEWNVGRCTDMRYMFCMAASFNQPLNKWDVGCVIDMRCMFIHAAAFNQPLSAWEVGCVLNMSWMFAGASTFNQPLDQWNVKIKRPETVLHNAIAFASDEPRWARDPKEDDD